MRVAALVPELFLGDPQKNADEIKKQYKIARNNGAQIVVTPELSLTGYTNGDLFGNDFLINETLCALKKLLNDKDLGTLIIGAPLKHKNKLYNTAVVIQNGEIKGVVPKTHLPNYGEFYEARHFAPARENTDKEIKIFGRAVPFGTDMIFGNDETKFGIEICEDAWVASAPSNEQAENGANIILNPSASNDIVGKADYRRTIVQSASGRQIGGYIYVSSGINESTSDMVFGGHAIIAENGGIIAENKRFDFSSNITYADINVRLLNNHRARNMSFQNKNTMRQIDLDFPSTKGKLLRTFTKLPFVPQNAEKRHERCQEILEMQSAGLAKRIKSMGTNPKCVLGLSGGLDSTLAFLVIERAYEKLDVPMKNLIAVTMQGFGTTDRTYKNACELAKSSGATLLEIPIRDAVKKHLADIGHDGATQDITYENAQARERTQILFDLANKERGIVVGTGDLSELALGFCTYNGDHMSNYAVNCSIPKTLVRHIVKTVAEEKNNKILFDIVDTPVSPELLPPNKDGTIAQKTEDFIGSYDLHDYFLYHRLRLGEDIKTTYELACQSFPDRPKKEIYDTLCTFERRFATQQFKRNCVPDGPKVGTVSLSPRGDLRMPSDMTLGAINKTLEEISKD